MLTLIPHMYCCISNTTFSLIALNIDFTIAAIPAALVGAFVGTHTTDYYAPDM